MDKKSIWTRQLILMALTVFFVRLGQGFQSGVSANFYVRELGLGGDQVLWLSGIREIPGLLLVFLAALITKLPLSRRAALSILLMGLGYGAYALVNSYLGLIAAALLGSIGFHNWMPLQSSLGMALVPKEKSGSIMGTLNGIGALASLGGMLLISLTVSRLGLRAFYLLAGAAFVVGVAMVWQLSTDVGEEKSPNKRKIVFKRRYWLYYVLTFFEGSRTQVFFAFGSWVLVEHYGMSAERLPLLLIVSGLVNMIGSPRMGEWIDRFGERRVLLGSYAGLVLCFIGYAMLHSVWLLSGLYVLINFLVTSRVALSTYVNRIALTGDLVPTLSAGVSVNHITSVSMSLLAGTLLQLVGYEGLSWGAAFMILLSVPFALMVQASPLPQPEKPAPAA
jgi:predicted MFS family arabinose efflux permease